MKGAELIKWIQDNHAEDWPVIALSPENDYLRVKYAWEGETDGGAIMLTCAADSNEDDSEQKAITKILSEVRKEKYSILAGVKLRSGEEGRIEEIRRRYWAYLLECLNKYHGAEGPYRKIHTSKSCYLYSATGIANFAIVCEAKVKGTAVEVVFKKPDEEANRSAFKYMKDRKEQIAKALGKAVDWWDEKKWTYCYINLSYQGRVDIRDEDTWEDMARFHMEWSKKFYKVFMPLLKEWKAEK